MKLCWDNIEDIRISSKGNFRDMVKGITYYYHDLCIQCGDPFLSSTKKCVFCGYHCSGVGENNNMYGKHHIEEC